MKNRFVLFASLLVIPAICWMVFAQGAQQKVKSKAYAGHENERDVQNFVQQYPKTVGTRLDNCQTCHRSGLAGTDTQKEYSPCGYCHLLQFGNPKYKTGMPKTFEDTLNPYGLAYKQNGRNAAALAAIAELDSDGDSFSNAKEIADLRYPGDKASRPGQPLAPTTSLTWDDIKKLPRHSQFVLVNTHSEQFDEYASFTGVKLIDILKAAKIDLTGSVGITVFAPDGYSSEYTIEDITAPFPKPYFYAAPQRITEQEKMLVRYPATIPPGVADGKEIPMTPWLLLAFERDGKPIDAAQYESGTGRMKGDGPYRIVKPQSNVAGDPVRPGRPDRSVKGKKFGDEWDYSDALDHNAAGCLRGAVAIRINPMPAGVEEFDWKNGWPLVDERKLIIFGKGVQGK